jgi:hypothetical protein
LPEHATVIEEVRETTVRLVWLLLDEWVASPA